MKKPSLILDLEKKVSSLVDKEITQKRQQMLLYCVKKRNIQNFDSKEFSYAYEKVKNFSLDVLTFRYKGELLFREYVAGSFPNLINKRYELADDLK